MRCMFRAICYCLLCGHAAIAAAGELSARLEAALAEARPAQSLAVARVQALDEALIDPASLQPAWARHDLRALRQLAAYERDCAGDLSAVSAPWRDFERARCGLRALPAGWFRLYPVHPLGGSSAWHWRQRQPLPELARWLHVRERGDELGQLGALSDDNLDALLAGERWLWQDGALWRQDGTAWRRYEAAVWRPLARAAGLDVAAASSGVCAEKLGGLCLNPAAQASPWRVALPGAALLLLLGGLALWWQRRRLQRERRFALQMLTHELRTPIAGLAGVVEGLRRDFDRLPESAQDRFGDLAGGVSRLRQLAEASRHYLSAERLDLRRRAAAVHLAGGCRRAPPGGVLSERRRGAVAAGLLADGMPGQSAGQCAPPWPPAAALVRGVGRPTAAAGRRRWRRSGRLPLAPAVAARWRRPGHGFGVGHRSTSTGANGRPAAAVRPAHHF